MCRMREGETLHVCTGSFLVLPKGQRLAHLRHREAQGPRPAQEAQRLHVGRGAAAVAGVAAPGRGDQADRLVAADHLG